MNNRTLKNLGKRNGFKVATVDFGLFHYECVCVAGPQEGLQGFVRGFYDGPEYVLPEKHKGVRGLFIHRKGRVPIVWVPRVPKAPGDYAALAHELLHVVIEMMNHYGMGLSECSEEAWTNALSHAMETALEGFKAN